MWLGRRPATTSAFQNQFYNWAARGAWEVAINTPNDQPLPFNAMTISNSLTEGSHAFEGYIHNSQINSNRQLNAIENFSTTAIRSDVWHYDSSGYQAPVLLPYGPNSYTPVYDGFTPDQNVFVPSYTPSYDHGSFIPWGW